MLLSTDNALDLIKDSKQFTDSNPHFPELGKRSILKGKSVTGRTEYLVDVRRSLYTLNKVTFQERVYSNIGLVRLDLDTKPHSNPDHSIIEGAHLHIYQEGYGLSWAYPLDDSHVKSLNPHVDLARVLTCKDPYDRFRLFSEYCYFINFPEFKDADYQEGVSLFDR